MKPPKEKELNDPDFECSEEFKVKKLLIEKRQRMMLLEMGKTISELKNGVYKLDRMPED